MPSHCLHTNTHGTYPPVISAVDILTLWQLSPEDFNEWRRKNDIPLLLQLFKNKLPFFDEWLKQYGIENHFILPSHTGRWFYGTEEKHLLEYHDKGNVCCKIIEHYDITKYEKSALIQDKKFIPYLCWGKKKTGKTRFIPYGANKQAYETLKYTSSMGLGASSRSALLPKNYVLKLGGVSLPNGTITGNRNLDFTDLNNLNLGGNHYGSYQTEITFSTCRHIKITGFIHHFTFTQCETENFTTAHAEIQNTKFIQCESNNHKLNNTKIHNLTYDQSKVFRTASTYIFSIEICELAGKFMRKHRSEELVCR